MTARRSDGRHYIDGAFVEPDTGHSEPVYDKATGATLGTYALGDTADVERAVAAARAAQPAWARTPPDDRAALLRAIAAGLVDRREEIADMLVRETGAIRAKADGEIGGAVRKLHETAALPNRMAGAILPSQKPGKLTLLERIPLGVVGAITPWNFPVVLAMRPLAPAIATGNTVVLKPAELTPIAGGQLLAEVCHDAGVPAGVVNVVTGDGPAAGEPLAAHPDVALVHFTGSVEVGRHLAAIVAGDLRLASLELGGDNAFVVLDDADVEQAAACGAWTAFEYQGQTCITASRHIVQRAVADAYIDALASRADRITVGDPAGGGVDLGPLISEAQRDRVHRRIVQPSLDAGARLVTGGTYDGLYYRPTVLVDVTPDMPAFVEEIFGPVAPVTIVDTEDEALNLVNRHKALVNAVYTGDLVRGLAFAQRVDSGMVHVNDAGGRPTDEGDLDEFTRTRWIGIQRQPLNYPYQR
jgi:benzaldehyde dehydrogenase (NAD)